MIARYDGFVARYVGDGILTYFGWPTAHEEDAERAVRAALEIVHTVKRASSTEDLSVRIGIATGPVVVRSNDALHVDLQSPFVEHLRECFAAGRDLSADRVADAVVPRPARAQ